MGPYYEYRHVVEFEETDHAGNSYVVNHVRWQGRCREMFLLEYVPSMLDGRCGNLTLATVESGCEYLAGIQAFDEISIRMRLDYLTGVHISLAFEYVRTCGADEELVATGWQRVVCTRAGGEPAIPVPIPEALRLALENYQVSGPPHTGSVRLGAGGRA